MPGSNKLWMWFHDGIEYVIKRKETIHALWRYLFSSGFYAAISTENDVAFCKG
jgi:hypothetical protein